MRVSPNGAPILQGTGLQSVHEKIRAAFDLVRVHAEIDIEVLANDAEIEVIELDAAACFDVLVYSALKDDTIIRSTAQPAGFQQTFEIDNVFESAEELIQLACDAMSETATNDDSYTFEIDAV